MALQSPFFNNNKREGETGYQPPRTGTNPNATGANNAASSMSTPSTSSSAPLPVPAPVTGAESKLTVGPNIKLKGVEITDCDTLVVEGSVEATMDSRVIQISERGAFKGSAEIDIAEIRGVFDGNLTVRQKLTIFATGKVTGRVRYGKIVIEEGGQLSGEIEAGASAVRNAGGTTLQQVKTA
jgi:cytoskeletal protein CcmA (bactofilin family)